ncbi:MAG: ATP-binding cassette domain-containing protein [Ruminococcus sp.]|nr:ATP-binding cassette domain-containing protein [Ruminococcus sp.]
MGLLEVPISFEISKGEYVALMGHSGCGKSTLLKLLMNIYPLDNGERYLLDNDGEKTITAEWHRLFAYVPQGNQLMSGTIREIVAFADRATMHNDERIINALQIACADKFVSELVNGIDTMLGERGAGLSEGQLQRIAIARAIYSDSPILLLDEATSALDEYTERQLLQNLRKMTDKTVLIVTHRPAVLEICDRVIDFSTL